MQNNYTKILLMALLFFPSYSASSAEPALEEIVVSAQRREESLLDVPVSITAFSKSQLEQNNITEVKDYFLFTPNVSFTEDGETGSRAVSLSMRGVSDFANAITGIGGLSNSFGIYVDEFNVANSANKVANPQLQDLERIEILRGPQGTYFGRNATGGALNLTTTLPSDQLYAELNGGFSRFDTWDVGTVVNIPVTDRFFVRAVASYEESDGFITNLSPTGNDDAYDHQNFRVALRWLATDNLTLDFSAMYTREDDGADSNINSGVFDTDTIGATPPVLPVEPGSSIFVPFAQIAPVDSGKGFFPHNRRYINKDVYETNLGEATILNLRANYQGDGWSLRTVTGYMDSEHHRQFDQDVSQFGLYVSEFHRLGESFSQEVRLNFGNDVWDVTVGGLYAKDTLDASSIGYIGTDGLYFASLNPDGTIASCGFCLPPGAIFPRSSFTPFEASSYAFFADATWQLSDRLSASLGVRYTNDEVEVKNYRGFAPINPVFYHGKTPDPSTLVNQGDADFDDLSPRFVLNFSPSDNINTYASVSAGYKPGGNQLTRNLMGDDVALPFDEERIWSYETGVKIKALDNRLRINASAFYMDWSDMQIPTLNVTIVNNSIASNTEIINTDAQSYGFELEVQALATDNLFLAAGVGYLKAEIDGLKDYAFEDIAFDLDGKTLPRSPEWTLNLVGQYNFRLMDLPAFVRLEWSYRDETTSDIEAVASQAQPLNKPGFNTDFSGNGLHFDWPRQKFPFVVPSFDVTNLRVGIEGERWSVNAYVENLFDDDYYTGTQENFGLGGIRIRPHFRVMGVNFKLYTN